MWKGERERERERKVYRKSALNPIKIIITDNIIIIIIIKTTSLLSPWYEITIIKRRNKKKKNDNTHCDLFFVVVAYKTTHKQTHTHTTIFKANKKSFYFCGQETLENNSFHLQN